MTQALEFRRGAAAIQEANEAAKNRGGDFRPFLRSIYWKDDKEERYVLFLNDLESIPQAEVIGFIPTEAGYFDSVIARTDPAIGERHDAFVDQWDATPRTTNLAIAVELEPVLEVVNGRKRPRGFEVKTVEFERRLRDDDGEITDESEEVTAPAIGIIAQSPNNFFNVIAAYDATEGPIHRIPLKITRIGEDQHTAYTVRGYDDQEVDLSNLLAFIDGISYLEDELDAVVTAIDGMADPEDAAHYIGQVLLEKRLQELADEERYNELLEGVTESLDKYGNKKKRGKKSERKTRPSQRRSSAPVETTGNADMPPEDEPEAEAEAPKAKRGRPKKAEVTADSPAKAKLDELKRKAAERRAKAS